MESSLQPGISIQQQLVHSEFCVSVNARMTSDRVSRHKPPFRVTIEPWCLYTAQMLGCRYGIATVGVGGSTDSSGMKQNMTAPSCVQQPLELSTVFVEVKQLMVAKTGFHLLMRHSSGYLILPHNNTSLGTSLEYVGPLGEGKMHCGNIQVSGYAIAPFTVFQSRQYHLSNITNAIHQQMCQIHGDTPLKVIDTNRTDACAFRLGKIQKGKPINGLHVDCLAKTATAEESFQLTLPNVAALFVSNDTESANFACLQASLKVEYIFVHHKLIAEAFARGRFDTTPGPRFPLLIPTKISVIDGICQRTIAPLAQAALFFSTETEWEQSSLASINRTDRFYAYMMAVSAGLFPLNNLPSPERSTDSDGTCMVRPVKNVTFVPRNWRLYLLCIGLLLAFLTIVIAIAFRCFYTGESWKVGSAHWSLARLLENGEQSNRETIIELVDVSGRETQEGPSDRQPTDENSSARFQAKGEAIPKSAPYQYRVIRNSLPSLTRRKSAIPPEQQQKDNGVP